MTRNHGPAARVGVDVGGTFTDFVVLEPGRLTVRKRLSTPHDPAVAVLSGLDSLGVDSQIPIAHGSTVATNALLERRGARVALITTRGFADVLEIGRQARPQLYDLRPTRPPALVPRSLRFEVDERMDRHGRPRRPLSDEQVAAVVACVVASGATAAAVCLLFSFANPAHEQAIGTALQRAGIDVSLSSDILPELREFERTSTTVANAYLRPVVTAYLEQLTAVLGSRLWVMQSDGTTVPPDRLAVRPVQAVLSGPAGGIVGALAVARAGGRAAHQSGTDGGRGGAALVGRRNILTLDMGGTSTAVAFCPGAPVLETQHEIGGVVLNLPMLAIHTVGAGGGSIARRDVAGGLHVGPASAGASPGPACYGRGGTAPTVTDANLVLGRLHPDWRLGGEVRLDSASARVAVLSLGDDTPRSDRTADAEAVTLANAIIRVVNAHMARALRVISIERGYDPRRCALVAFGGAGPLHAAALAEALDIREVIVPRYPGVLSAVGTALAEVERSYSRTVMLTVERAAGTELLPGTPGASSSDPPDAPETAAVATALADAYADLERQASSELRATLGPVRLELRRSLDCRYQGQSHELLVAAGRTRRVRAGGTPASQAGNKPRAELRALQALQAAVRSFDRLHRRRYGYDQADRAVEIVTIRLRARHLQPSVALPEAPRDQQRGEPAPAGHTVLWDDAQPVTAPIFEREHCGPGTHLVGPALIVQADATTVLPVGWAAQADRYGSLLLRRYA